MIGFDDGMGPVVAASQLKPAIVFGVLSVVSKFLDVFPDRAVPLVEARPKLVRVNSPVMGSGQVVAFLLDLSQCTDEQVQKIAEICAVSGQGDVGVILEQLRKQKHLPVHPREILATVAGGVLK